MKVASLTMTVSVAGWLFAAIAVAQNPFGTPTTSTPPPVLDPGAPETPLTAENLGPETDPTILTLREMNPTSPVELVRAMQITTNMGRLDEASFYADKLIAANPDEATQLELHRKYGSALFLKLSDERRFGADVARLARSILEAAGKQARRDDRTETLVKQLSSNDPAAREIALNDLRGIPTQSLPMLVQALGDPTRRAEAPQLRRAVLQLGDAAIQPLIGAIQSNNSTLLIESAEMLAQLNGRAATPYLVRPYLDASEELPVRVAAARSLKSMAGDTPTMGEGLKYLRLRTDSLLDGAPPSRVDDQGRVVLWQWNETAGTIERNQYPQEAASFVAARRLISDLRRLAPENKEYQRLSLLTSLQAVKLTQGLNLPIEPDEPVRKEAFEAGIDVLLETLKEALRLDYGPAAIGAIEFLGETGGLKLLDSDSGRPGPLTSAFGNRSRQVRYAAAKTILELDPQGPYAGSSRLMESLVFFARSAGSRRALIAAPRVRQAQAVAGLLNEVGYDSDATTTGKDLLRRASRQPDYEMVLLSMSIDRPPAAETLQLLRRDPRTANLPVALFANAEQIVRAQQIADTDELALALPRPHNVATLSFYIHRLTDLAADRRVPEEQRVVQAQRALAALLKFARKPEVYEFYNVLSFEEEFLGVLRSQLLANEGAQLLGAIATPRAQQALVDVASDNGLPLERRQSAVDAFAAAVDRRGVLLATPNILLQYARYNKSGSLDEPTQELLWSILSIIQDAKKRADRTGREPAPAAAADLDTGAPDTGAPDTGAPDTGAPDTDAPDTGAPDTGAPDTVPAAAAPAVGDGG